MQALLYFQSLTEQRRLEENPWYHQESTPIRWDMKKKTVESMSDYSCSWSFLSNGCLFTYNDLVLCPARLKRGPSEVDQVVQTGEQK